MHRSWCYSRILTSYPSMWPQSLARCRTLPAFQKNFPCSPQSIPTPHQSPEAAAFWFFHHRLVLLIFRTLYKWNHALWTLCTWLLSNNTVLWRLIHDVVYNSFLLLSSIPWYDYTITYLSTFCYHELKLLWISLYTFFWWPYVFISLE